MKHLYVRFQWIALYSRRGPAWVLQHIRAQMWFNLAASGASDASDRDQSVK